MPIYEAIKIPIYRRIFPVRIPHNTPSKQHPHRFRQGVKSERRSNRFRSFDSRSSNTSPMREQRGRWPVNVPEALATRTPIPLGPNRMGGFLFAGSRNLGLIWNRAIPHLALSGLYCNPSLTRSGWDCCTTAPCEILLCYPFYRNLFKLLMM